MNDIEIFESKILLTKRKMRLYLYLGYFLLLIGVCLLTYSRTIGFIVTGAGIYLRVLYYFAHFDLKSMRRIHKKMQIVPLIFLFFISFTLKALEPGQRVAEFNDLEFLKGEKVKLFNSDGAVDKIVVVELWAPWDKGSLLAFKLLSEIQKKYKDKGVIILGISKDDKLVIKRCLNIYDKDISYSIAYDPESKNIDSLAGADARVPLVFIIGKDGKILWRGHPLELKSVLDQILKGTFSLEKQIKISKLQKRMQAFLQIEDIKNAIATADKMLKLDPDNDIAMRVKLFEYESTKQFMQALLFIDKQIEEHPLSEKLYFIKINLMKKNKLPVSAMHETLQTIFEKFQNNHNALHKLAWSAVNDMEFGDTPLKLALDSSKKSVELLLNSNDQDPAVLALYLSTQAQIYYMIGALDQAIAIEEKVIKLQTGDVPESRSKKILQYYKNAASLK